MTIYAWTIKVPGHQDVQHVTEFAELCDYLRVMDLPGVAPPEFVTLDAEVHDHGTYIHNEGSVDEWSLTWTKVDGNAEVFD
ncbi:hypothetical protein LJR098_006031 [Rhizobium sp. LjRoot98]|uniref:hypothetical protein n=1 Tax=unclassified Rhizobium TaxID=2613769 RepID=UPI0007150618|nr:hypothetical protein [Rhizobium sp. Root1204]KQV41526.1 hypothetical protein ASC96_17065 [Rhizobium sp. Root1204]